MSRSALRHRRGTLSQALTSAYDLNVLAGAPILYLPLSADGNDQSGNGHNGTMYNAPTRSTFLDGSSCLVFNGTSQYIEIPNHDRLSVPATGILTLEMWIRPDQLDLPTIEANGAPYTYFAGKNDAGQGTAEYVCRIYSKMSTWTDADWAAVNISPPRPNRISGYANNLGPLIPGTSNLGAGSYFQDAVTAPVLGVGQEWIHYVLIINTVNVSSAYTTGYTKIYKNGDLRMQRNLTDYSIVPQHGDAPLRIATSTKHSYFPGAMAKFVMWGYEPSPSQIHERYRLIVPAATGSIRHIGHVGDVTKTTSGTKITVTVPASGVPAGSTILATVAHAWTSSSPTVGDSKGNLYHLDRSTANTALTMRETVFSAPVNADLVAGDVIQATVPGAVDRRILEVDAFGGIGFADPQMDRQNTGQGTSATPGTATTAGPTTQADELVYGAIIVAGPSTDGYTNDADAEFTALHRSGTTTGVNDITVDRGWKSVTTTGSYKFQPVLGTSRNWLTIVATYKAGPAVVVPPTVGSATHVDFVGEATATGSGTSLSVTVVGDGVQAGHTLIVSCMADYTSSGPTCSDARGNTFARNKTIPSAALTMRMAVFTAPIAVALEPGDTITVAWPGAVAGRVVTVNSFAGVATPVVVDATNNNAQTGVAPSTTLTTTSAAPDALLFALVAMEGPVEDDYEPDAGHQWAPLQRTGTTGGSPASTNRTLMTAYRSVGAYGPYTYAPALGTSRSYVVAALAFPAGAFTVTPPPTGTGTLVKALGTASAATAGTTLTITVPAGGVAIGNTMIVTYTGDFAGSAPSISDARSNAWTRDKSGADGANTLRSAIYSAPVTTALLAGDVITLTSSSLSHRSFAANEFHGILVPTAVDASNASSHNGTSPTTQVVTVTADTLIVVALGVAGDSADTYTNDTANGWKPLARVGTTGGTFGDNRTLNSAYRSVGAQGTYPHHPTLGTTSICSGEIVAYKAG